MPGDLNITGGSIESQFWFRLQTTEPNPWNLDLEVVEIFPDAIMSQAKELQCWALLASTKYPTVVGFDLVRVKMQVMKAWVIVNENLVVQQCIVRDLSEAFLLKPEQCASYLEFSFRILKQEFDHQMWDGHMLTEKVRADADFPLESNDLPNE